MLLRIDDHATHRNAHDVDAVPAEVIEELERIVGHLLCGEPRLIRHPWRPENAWAVKVIKEVHAIPL